MRIDAEGTCAVRVMAPARWQRCVVAAIAGLAAGWETLPGPLREGIICLAGSQFQGGVGANMAPPASVTALWLPWRRVRLT